jgi:AcrR family transcriptional regulator
MVVDAAFAVFVEQGYDGASMDAIAARAEVSKPVVYACFESKDELFTALLVREERRIMAEVVAAIPAQPDDLESALSAGLTAFMRSVASAPEAFGLFFLGRGGSHAIARRVQRDREEQVEALAAFLEEWLEQRGAADADSTAVLIAHALIGAAEGAARALLANPDDVVPEVAGPALARVMARGAVNL